MITKLNPHNIDWSNCRVVISGQVVEIYSYERPFFYNRVFKEKLLSPTSQNERREDNVTISRRYLRRLIFSNCNVWSNCTAFMTFTFAENVKNLQVANKEWAKFMRRLNFEIGFNLRYTCVVEFQKRGAVHYHVLFYNLPNVWIQSEMKAQKNRKNLIHDDYKYPKGESWQIRYDYFLENDAIGKIGLIWKYLGQIDIKTIEKMRSIRSVGAYVAKYLSKETMDSRLLRQKVYFSSKGLKKPIEYRHHDTAKKMLDEIKTFDVDIKKVYHTHYQSRSYGVIDYKQYLISDKNENSNNKH